LLKVFIRFIFLLLCLFLLSGCVKQPAFENNSLAFRLQSLDKTLSAQQAEIIAQNIFAVSKEIKEEFKPISFPWFNNFLVNVGLKEKGLCWEYRDALLFRLKPKIIPLTLLPVVANQDKLNEHNAVIIASKNINFEDALLLDLWRESGNPYIVRVGDDTKYNWLISFSHARCVYRN
jgi:hypothetical protein